MSGEKILTVGNPNSYSCKICPISGTFLSLLYLFTIYAWTRNAVKSHKTHIPDSSRPTIATNKKEKASE